MTDSDIEELKRKADQKLFEYIVLLEATNDNLLDTLKQCVELLSYFTEHTPVPEGLQEIIDELDDTIIIGERIVIKETIH